MWSEIVDCVVGFCQCLPPVVWVYRLEQTVRLDHLNIRKKKTRMSSQYHLLLSWHPASLWPHDEAGMVGFDLFCASSAYESSCTSVWLHSCHHDCMSLFSSDNHSASGGESAPTDREQRTFQIWSKHIDRREPRSIKGLCWVSRYPSVGLSYLLGFGSRDFVHIIHGQLTTS